MIRSFHFPRSPKRSVTGRTQRLAEYSSASLARLRGGTGVNQCRTRLASANDESRLPLYDSISRPSLTSTCRLHIGRERQGSNPQCDASKVVIEGPSKGIPSSTHSLKNMCSWTANWRFLAREIKHLRGSVCRYLSTGTILPIGKRVFYH